MEMKRRRNDDVVKIRSFLGGEDEEVVDVEVYYYY